MFAPSIPAGHFMSVGNRVESSWVPGRLGTVTRDLGDRYVLVDWDDLDVDTVCNDDDLEPAPSASLDRSDSLDADVAMRSAIQEDAENARDGYRD